MLVKTPRLKLIPCPLEVAQAAKEKSRIEQLLKISVPDNWYNCEVQDLLPKYAQTLMEDMSQLGWGVWLIVCEENSTLIGDLGFLGKPDAQGTVEMGYEVIPAYRQQGYAFEAVQALVSFTLSQPKLKKIIAHCPEDHIPSIRILQKLGMQRKELVDNILPGTRVFKWELEIQ